MALVVLLGHFHEQGSGSELESVLQVVVGRFVDLDPVPGRSA
ncbi:MAG: hypothetical protein U5L11_09070 [Arhodomonas sp.]|nr:hypothetical protein [Arhodomonas sp.]